MKILSQLLMIILFTQVSFAQSPCNEDTIMAIKGKWAKSGGSNSYRAKSPQVIIRLDKMVQLLEAAYPEPKGIEAHWDSEMGRHESLVKNGPLSYDLLASFKKYYCENIIGNAGNNFKNSYGNKHFLGDETGTWFYVWVNRFGWFAREDGDFKIDNRQVYTLTPGMGELNGFQVYAGNDGNTPNQYSRTILITRTGQLPYTPVSRKQYLQAFLKEKEANYLRQKGSIPETYYQKEIKAAKEYIANNSDEELAKPAYHEGPNHSYDFKKFADENKGHMMIQVNESYFNSKLPAYIPQFFVAYWRWESSKPSLNYAAKIEKNFDFTALQQLLDK